MNILEFLRAIDGLAQLWAANGQFLGVLSSNQYDINSIFNPNGLYGSSCSPTSIRAEYSIYGGEYGMYSPYNSYCLNLPVIFYQNQGVLVVTRNRYPMTNGIQVIDPDLLFIAYNINARAVPDPSSIYAQMHCDNLNFVASLSRSLTQPWLSSPL